MISASAQHQLLPAPDADQAHPETTRNQKDKTSINRNARTFSIVVLCEIRAKSTAFINRTTSTRVIDTTFARNTGPSAIAHRVSGIIVTTPMLPAISARAIQAAVVRVLCEIVGAIVLGGDAHE